MSDFSRRTLLGAAGAVVAAAITSDGVPVATAVAEPKFKLGLVTYMIGSKWDVPTLIDECTKTGVAAVELRTTHAHGVEPTLNADQRKDVRKRFEDSGVVLWGLGSTCEFHAPDQAVVAKNIETCKQFLQLAADVGARGVKVRPNGLPEGVPVEKTVEQIGRSLTACGQAAEGLNVEVWVEVHGKGSNAPPLCKRMMEIAGHKSVGLTWNSNAEDVTNGSVAQSFAMLWPWVKSCHINDLWRESTGAYPYRELFRLLRENGYDRYTLCEVGRTPADTAAAEDYLRNYRALWLELTRA